MERNGKAEPGHAPVLLRESLEALNIRPDGIYVDGTLGRGGHARETASRLVSGRLIGIDRDGEAISACAKSLAVFGDRITLVRGDFGEIGEILDNLGIDKVDGMLFDLGLSSPQIDEAERGFSYMSDAPLDMRMDRSAALTAREIVNGWDESEIKRILYEYGEERYASKIAASIIAARRRREISTTLELVEIIKSAMPASALREKQHPAKRSFQALRIAVNDELGSLGKMLAAAPDRLKTGGRLCVISFHSLEDRLVKREIRKRERGCTCPSGFPVCVCGFRQTLRALGGPISPSKEELEANHRARSAKLRVAERI